MDMVKPESMGNPPSISHRTIRSFRGRALASSAPTPAKACKVFERNNLGLDFAGISLFFWETSIRRQGRSGVDLSSEMGLISTRSDVEGFRIY
jgi:hypothetical protein